MHAISGPASGPVPTVGAIHLALGPVPALGRPHPALGPVPAFVPALVGGACPRLGCPTTLGAPPWAVRPALGPVPALALFATIGPVLTWKWLSHLRCF